MNIKGLHKRIFISVGEASGDLLGAKLIESIHATDNSITIDAMGGSKMKSAGANIVVDADKMAVVGIWEIITHLRVIRQAFKTIKKQFETQRPDLLILVDYPGFNLRLAKIAKRYNIRVMYYVSPQIWAWRYGRIKHIKKYIDHMAVLFPFEETLYKKEKMPVTFVGHPIVDTVKPTLPAEQVRQKFNLDPSNPTIALFPGSRHSEVTRLMPIIIKTIPLIKERFPNAQFVLPIASSLTKEAFSAYDLKNVTLVPNNNYNLLQVADAVITASGTATLEIAITETPMVIIYKVSVLSAIIAKLVLRIPYIGLCNIVAEQCVAKELLQLNASPQKISSEVIKLLDDKAYREQVLEKLAHVKENLSAVDASKQAAKVALILLRKQWEIIQA